MNESNFYSDIKESIENHFSFLKDFGFSKFEEKQIAYEIHFEAKNNFVSIDISFEATSSTPIWATINGYSIGTLELNNSKIEEYRTELKENYDYLFEQYLKTHKNIFLDKLSKQYAVNGKEINDKYLKELGEILKRHTTVLDGDFELLKSNSKILEKEFELKVALERIKNNTYTLEYQFFSEDDYDIFKEFNSIEDIKQFLADQSEIKKYRVLDCYMNEIVLDV